MIGIEEGTPPLTHSRLWNPDLAPVPPEKRTWTSYNYAALWTTFTVNIATYLVASAMIASGMSWGEALFTIALGHLIVLVPILLNAHAGAKYGIPFPVYSRASFGVHGANVAAMLRALVACGWFGIQTWIGGQAIDRLVFAFYPAWPLNGWGRWVCFFGFWLLNLIVVLRGMSLVRRMQAWCAPFLMAVSMTLLAWVYLRAGGIGPALAVPSRLHTHAQFLAVFVPALTGTVAHWAAIALNISDFTRYSRSQKDQLLGQALSLPVAMTLYSFIAIVVTLATIAIFGRPIWDPVEVLSHLGNPWAVALALLALLLATLNVNVAANLVAPANDFSNLAPTRISFRGGAVITCLVGLLMQPWKLMATHGNFITGWLVGYSSFLGPVAGVLISDYFLIRRTRLDLRGLYQDAGPYTYAHGFNPRALVALALGILLSLIGRLVAPWDVGPGAHPLLHLIHASYNFAWFIGFAVSSVSYVALMRSATRYATTAGRDSSAVVH